MAMETIWVCASRALHSSILRKNFEMSTPCSRGSHLWRKRMLGREVKALVEADLEHMYGIQRKFIIFILGFIVPCANFFLFVHDFSKSPSLPSRRIGQKSANNACQSDVSRLYLVESSDFPANFLSNFVGFFSFCFHQLN